MTRTLTDKQRKAMFAKRGGPRGGSPRRRGIRHSPARLTSRQQALVAENTRLVHQIARRFRSAPVAYEDLVGEGNLGLIAAARNFKQEKGKKFSTLATRHITRHVKDAIGQAQTVRVPRKKAGKLKQAGHALPLSVSFDEVGERASSGGMRRAEARATLRIIRRRANELPEKVRRVFLTKYYSNGHARPEPWTSRQVAKRLKMSLGNVSRLEKEAKRKLRIA